MADVGTNADLVLKRLEIVRNEKELSIQKSELSLLELDEKRVSIQAGIDKARIEVKDLERQIAEHKKKRGSGA